MSMRSFSEFGRNFLRSPKDAEGSLYRLSGLTSQTEKLMAGLSLNVAHLLVMSELLLEFMKDADKKPAGDLDALRQTCVTIADNIVQLNAVREKLVNQICSIKTEFGDRPDAK